MTITQALEYIPQGTYMQDAKFLSFAEDFILNKSNDLHHRYLMCRKYDICCYGYEPDQEGWTEQQVVDEYVASIEQIIEDVAAEMRRQR